MFPLASAAYAQEPSTPPAWVTRGAAEYPAEVPAETPAEVLCRVSIAVDEAGRFADLAVVHCPDAFHDVARAAAAASSWTPATAGGVAVPGRVEVIYKFVRPTPEPAPEPDRDFHHTEIEWKRRVVPLYPAHAEYSGMGDVDCRVRLFVDAAGAFSDIEFIACPSVFQATARAAAARSEWYPPTIDGQPVTSQFVLIYQFKASDAALGPPRRWCPGAERVPLTTFREVATLAVTVRPDLDAPADCRVLVAVEADGTPSHAAVPADVGLPYGRLLRAWCAARFEPPGTPVFVERACAP